MRCAFAYRQAFLFALCSIAFSKTSHLFALSLPPPASARRGFLQARSRCLGLPCDSPMCATQDASKPTFATRTFDNEHPRLVGFRCESLCFRVCARTNNQAFHDARFASACPWVIFRGGPLRPMSIARRRDHDPSDRASDPSVASRRADRRRIACRPFRNRRGRFFRVSVKITRR
jgi:hypothetical protein